MAASSLEDAYQEYKSKFGDKVGNAAQFTNYLQKHYSGQWKYKDVRDFFQSKKKDSGSSNNSNSPRSRKAQYEASKDNNNNKNTDGNESKSKRVARNSKSVKKNMKKPKPKDKRRARRSKSVKQSNTHVSESSYRPIVTDKALQGVSVKQRIGQIKSMSMDLNGGINNIMVNTHRSRTLTWDVTADFANYDVSIEDRIKRVYQLLSQDFKEEDDFENDEKLKLITIKTMKENKVQDIISKIENINQHSKSIENLTKEFEINKKSNLIINNKIKEDHSYFDQRFETYFTPLTKDDPIINISLDLPFNQWTNDKQNEFLNDLANTLNVNIHQLIPICVANGSTQLSILLCKILHEQFPTIQKKFVQLETAKNKTSTKWQLKRASMKSWFKKKLSKVKKNNSGNGTATDTTSTDTKKEDDDDDIDDNKTETELTGEEKWLLEKGRSLRKLLTKSIQNCSEEYEILSIVLLDNDICLSNFIQTPNYKKSKLLFHGTKIKNLPKIYDIGFNDDLISSSTDDGWYGKGHYFSSFPQYCMEYCEENKCGQSTLIVSYVNCGNTLNIYENNKYEGKNIENGIDAHYVRVTTSGLAIGEKSIKEHTSGVDMFDEYVIKSGKYILPRYCVTFRKINKLIIWRDPKVYNYENLYMLRELQKLGHTIYAAENTQDALTVLKRKKLENNNVFVITNGADNSEQFIHEIRNKCNCNENVLVYTGTYKYAKNYEKFENVQITVDPSKVFDFVDTHLGHQE